MKEKSVIPINQEEISSYLKDIRKLAVMTPERERELAEKMLNPKTSQREIITNIFKSSGITGQTKVIFDNYSFTVI